MSKSQDAIKAAQSYPTPLSPPLPPISKDIELARALTASSKSSLYSLSRSDVLYEDGWLLVVKAPRSLLQPELHLANRLDRNTSGVMVVTKSHKVASKLVKAFLNTRLGKHILLFASVQHQSGKDHHPIRSRKVKIWSLASVRCIRCESDSTRWVHCRDMETSFEVLSVNGQGRYKELVEFTKDEENVIVVERKAVIDGDAKKDEILVRAFPRSGRTRQIRLHCQYLGISIRGDVKYEGVYEWRGRIYDGHELHAESLSFEYSITGLPVMFQAPLPLWAMQALQPS
ncbi:RNA pseudouridine synthase 1-like [Tripterygium wilfordii]|uniref:RNA pseudouridine synthase 1-like n=1 Tax=Tripterygium wilfordii TaxID=458696 RepID=A0A7J7D181_TRIWF|nr:RNA pseudouridine synthase 1-like [Tripterygium wilfordii]